MVRADFLVVDAVIRNRSPSGGFPGNRERTRNFKPKRPGGENRWRFPTVKSMACGTISCKPEQGIKSSEQGKDIARSGTGCRRQGIIRAVTVHRPFACLFVLGC